MHELHRLSADEYKKKYESGNVIVLDNVRSAFNVGSIFRSADCFGISKVYLCGITCHIENRELQKSALGSELSVDSEYIERTMTILDQLIQEDFIVVSIEQTKNSLPLNTYDFEKVKKYAFVLGNEVEGVAEDIILKSHSVIEIPQIGTKHSLNISSAASIVLWEAFRQQS